MFEIWMLIFCYHVSVNTSCLKKTVPTYMYFCSMSVKYKPISIKAGRHVQEETLNKTMQKVPTSPKICASTTLGHLKSQIYPSTPYLHVHFNVSQTRLAVIVSKIVSYLSYIIFTIHARNVHLQCELRSQMSTNWDDASKTSEQSESRCSLNVRLATWRRRLRACVRAGCRHFEHIM